VATIVITPVALRDASIIISGTQFTYDDIIWHLRCESNLTDDRLIFERAYRDHYGTWELDDGWERRVAEDLTLFQLGKAVPPYVVARIVGIMSAGK